MKANRASLRQPASLLFSMVLAGSLGAQTTPTDTTPAPSSPPAAAVAADQTSAPKEKVQVLTPFEVNAAKDQGYFAQNTLAGTRLNNNIADLPSSVTVVTKQQLEDTSSQNINDGFRYEANTQGVSTYTP
ncbi:MAG TPA: hypothetical protein VN877_09405, partial [Opitutaceae bacterium]|nr:hypothetical protein [Opitutaceae bacterium]